MYNPIAVANDGTYLYVVAATGSKVTRILISNPATFNNNFISTGYSNGKCNNISIYGDYIYIASRGVIGKWNRSDGTLVNSSFITIPGGDNSSDYMANDGTHLYLCGSSSTNWIKQLSISTGEMVDPSFVTNGGFYPICCYGNFLYTSLNGSNIVKIDLNSKVQTQIYSGDSDFSTYGIGGIITNGNYMYVSMNPGPNQAGFIKTLRFISGTLTFVQNSANTINGGAYFLKNPTGMTWNGSILYVCQWWATSGADSVNYSSADTFTPSYAVYTPVITSIIPGAGYIAIHFTPPKSGTPIGYVYSLNGGTTFSSIYSQTTSPIIATGFYVANTYTVTVHAIAADNSYGPASNAVSVTTINYPCFLQSTKILTNRGYVPIEKLTTQSLVKTVADGYKRVWRIGKREIHHPASEERIKNQLYVCSADVFPEVFQDLVMTGCHSLLVEEWTSDEERDRAIEANGGNVYITDNYYRLPACADLRTDVYPTPGEYTIYHIALENDNYYTNYGIYANGLLVESCSKRYLKELSGMELIES